MFEMTNTLDEINSGLDNTEEKMSEFKEIAIKPIQSETEMVEINLHRIILPTTMFLFIRITE